MARDMMLTMDEYLAIRRLIESERESEGSSLTAPAAETKKRRRVSRYQKTFGRNLKQLDASARLKNGSYRSGMTKAKILSKAHKQTRKELGMR